MTLEKDKMFDAVNNERFKLFEDLQLGLIAAKEEEKVMF